MEVSYEVAMEALRQAQTAKELDEAIKAAAKALIREKLQLREGE